jgi:aromatic ring-opening dioxygenase catalytic subunit (LigB family)
MGEVVAAIFTTHVPRLMITDPDARRAYMGNNVTTFYDAMPRLERERLHALDFDTFIVIDSHWFTTLEYILNAHERLAGVYTSEELPQMLHDLEYDYRGDPELAGAIERSAHQHKMRAVASAARNLPIHYPTLNVMCYFNPECRRRVLPVSVCQTASVENDIAFGIALSDAISSSNRRVVLVASGGFINIFAVPAAVSLRNAFQTGDLARAEEIQRRLNRCFPRGGEETLGHLGTTKVTASVVTGIDMGPARPPYMAPDDAAERLQKRLPALLEII